MLQEVVVLHGLECVDKNGIFKIKFININLNFIKQYGSAKIPSLSETGPPSIQPRKIQTLKRAVHPDSDDDIDALD